MRLRSRRGLPATAQHFEALIVSQAFAGQSRVQRSTSSSTAALGDRMREEIHALSMQTLTPATQWAEPHRWISC